MLSNYRSGDIDDFTQRNGWILKEYDLRLSAPTAKNKRKKEILVINYEPENKLF
jgi:hypothetical protein